MATNRYTELTPSQFDPLKLEEIMMVPAMKRKQHDDLLAKQELIRSGLAKVNPLDVHYNEAVKLKQDLESQMDKTAGELAQKGISPDMNAKLIAMNRQYNDLVSPTGRIGQINTAYAAEAAAKKSFMENPAYKEYPPEAIQKAWQTHRSKYAGYETPGDPTSKIVNIGDLSGPKYEDMQKDFMDLSSRLGEQTRTQLQRMGAHFEAGPFGGVIMKTADGETINTDNDKNLKALAETMKTKYLMPTGEGYKSREFAGYDKQNTLDQLNSMMGIPAIDKEIKRMNYGDQFINAPSDGTKKEKQPTPPTVLQQGLVSNEVKNRKLAEEIEGPGVMSLLWSLTGVGDPLSMTTQNNGLAPSEIQARNKSIEEQKQIVLQGLIGAGKLPKNATYKDQKTKDVVIEYLKNNAVTSATEYVTLDREQDPYLGASKLAPKDVKERSLSLQKDLFNNRSNLVLETGGEMDNQWIKDNVKSISYDSYVAPGSRPDKGMFKNPKDNILSSQVNLTLNDGRVVTGHISRNSAERETPEYKASEKLYHLVNAGTGFANLTTKVKPQYLPKGYKDLNIMFDTNKRTYFLTGHNTAGKKISVSLPEADFKNAIMENELMR